MSSDCDHTPSSTRRGGLPLVRGLGRIRESVSPCTEAEAAVVADQLRLTRGSSNVTDAVLPIAAALIAFGCRGAVPAAILIAWVATIAAICLAMNRTAQRLDRFMARGVDGVRHVARIRTALTAALLAAWSAMGIALWVPGDAINHMFIVLVLACSLASSASMLAAHPASVAVALATEGGMLVLRPALAGDALDLTLAGLGLVFAVMMASQVRVVFRMAEHARELEFERHTILRELKRAKRESDRDRAEAAKAGRARSEFLSNMNHELRTPMNAILGFSELIKSKAFGSEIDKYSDYAGIIHDSGRQLLALLNDMLDLAKIEGGRLTLEESRFSLAGLIREVVASQREAAQAAGLTPEITLAPGLPEIEADPRAIRNILANLLSNAIKFTPPGGRVTVSAGVEADGRMAIAVEDSGIGIAPEEQLQVFERFGRRRHDVAIADQGTGLGLAIVKGFAEALDGEVALESEPGVGTRVTVNLPAERVHTLAPPARNVG